MSLRPDEIASRAEVWPADRSLDTPGTESSTESTPLAQCLVPSIGSRL